jgi:hypothetical protein
MFRVARAVHWGGGGCGQEEEKEDEDNESKGHLSRLPCIAFILSR